MEDMSWKHVLLLSLCVALLLTATACSNRKVIIGPRGRVIIVDTEPPPPRYEHRPPAPGPRWAWRPGHWERQGREWFWVPGAWERIPGQHRQWVPGRWAPGRQGRWHWTPGRWN